MLGYTDCHLRAAWFGRDPISFQPAGEWTDEYLDWNERADLARARRLRPSEGWIGVREGVAEGPLLAGCLESICWQLKGSAAWIDPADAILFLETADEARTPAHVDGYLTDLEQLGVFDRVAGLVVGRPYAYSDDARRELWRVVRERTDAGTVPVLANVDLGHTDPMLTLPLGAAARLDAGAGELRLLEAPTADGPRVRAARPADLEALAAVQLAGWRAAFVGIVPRELEPTAEHLIERLQEHGAGPSRRRVVAERDGALAGFCTFGPSRDADAGAGVGEIHALFVDPVAWRRRIGTALVLRALHDLRAGGFEEVTLWSFAEGARANAFYERRGFSRDGGEQSRPELGHARELRYRRSLRSRLR